MDQRVQTFRLGGGGLTPFMEASPFQLGDLKNQQSKYTDFSQGESKPNRLLVSDGNALARKIQAKMPWIGNVPHLAEKSPIPPG